MMRQVHIHNHTGAVGPHSPVRLKKTRDCGSDCECDSCRSQTHDASLTRGARVERKSNPTHTGTVSQVNYKSDGTTVVKVRWDNGWIETLPQNELRVNTASSQPVHTEIEQVKAGLKGGKDADIDEHLARKIVVTGKEQVGTWGNGTTPAEAERWLRKERGYSDKQISELKGKAGGKDYQSERGYVGRIYAVAGGPLIEESEPFIRPERAAAWIGEQVAKAARIGRHVFGRVINVFYDPNRARDTDLPKTYGEILYAKGRKRLSYTPQSFQFDPISGLKMWHLVRSDGKQVKVSVARYRDLSRQGRLTKS